MPTQRDISRLSITQLAWISRVAKETASKKLREAQLDPVAQDARATYYDPRDAIPILLGVGDGLNPAAERARLDRAKSELAELELERERGNVVPREDQQQALIALATAVASRLDGVPPKAAHEVASETDPAICQEIIARCIREAREDLAAAGASIGAGEDQRRKRDRSEDGRRSRRGAGRDAAAAESRSTRVG
jgi:phage terminase Nu1 subunit (DNA packaging protein)